MIAPFAFSKMLPELKEALPSAFSVMLPEPNVAPLVVVLPLSVTACRSIVEGAAPTSDASRTTVPVKPLTEVTGLAGVASSVQSDRVEPPSVVMTQVLPVSVRIAQSPR